MAVTRSAPAPSLMDALELDGPRILPIDGLMAMYNLFLAVLWLGAAPGSGVAWLAAGLHVLVATLPWWLPRGPAPGRGAASFVRELYPLLLLPIFWGEIDALFPLRHAATFDTHIHGLEQALFGLQLGESWMPSAPWTWLSELMHFSYFAYYGAVYLPPLVMAFAGRRRATQDMVFRLMAAYLACYVIYLLFPVDGPHFRHEPYQGDLTGGFWYGLVAATQAAGDSRGCAFPSSHVVGAVTAAYLGWRWLPRPVAWLLGIEALGVVASTVYTQNHYGVDSLAGATVAMALQLLILPPLLARMDAVESGRAGVVLPRMNGPVPVLWTGRSRWRRSWTT